MTSSRQSGGSCLPAEHQWIEIPFFRQLPNPLRVWRCPICSMLGVLRGAHVYYVVRAGPEDTRFVTRSPGAREPGCDDWRSNALAKARADEERIRKARGLSPTGSTLSPSPTASGSMTTSSGISEPERPTPKKTAPDERQSAFAGFMGR